jgi:hypothetical protein
LVGTPSAEAAAFNASWCDLMTGAESEATFLAWASDPDARSVSSSRIAVMWPASWVETRSWSNALPLAAWSRAANRLLVGVGRGGQGHAQGRGGLLQRLVESRVVGDE